MVKFYNLQNLFSSYLQVLHSMQWHNNTTTFFIIRYQYGMLNELLNHGSLFCDIDDDM